MFHIRGIIDRKGAGEKRQAHDLIPASILFGFEELVEELGGEPTRLSSDVGIASDILRDKQEFVPLIQVARLLNHAAKELECSDFGMRLAESKVSMRLSPELETLLSSAPNYLAAVRWAVDYGHSYSSSVYIKLNYIQKLRVYTEVFHLASYHLPVHAQMMEMILLKAQRAIRELSGDTARAFEVNFSHQRLSKATRYSNAFGAVVKFGQDYDLLLYTEEALNAPALQPDVATFQRELEGVASKFGRNSIDFALEIRDLVRALLLRGDCSRNQLQAILGVSKSALHRRLRSAGTTFEQIRDQQRQSLMLQYLASDLSLTEISFKLGLSEPAALTRCCHRWFGRSPRQMRQSLKSSAVPTANAGPSPSTIFRSSHPSKPERGDGSHHCG